MKQHCLNDREIKALTLYNEAARSDGQRPDPQAYVVKSTLEDRITYTVYSREGTDLMTFTREELTEGYDF